MVGCKREVSRFDGRHYPSSDLWIEINLKMAVQNLALHWKEIEDR
jgi:hypothetical protein